MSWKGPLSERALIVRKKCSKLAFVVGIAKAKKV